MNNVMTIIGTSMRGCTKITTLKEKSSQGQMCSPARDRQKIKRLPDQLLCGQKYRPKLAIPHKKEKKRMGECET